MSDIALLYDDTNLRFDLALEGGDLALDQGLHTAVLISLLSDRLAHPDDELPNAGLAHGADDGLPPDRRGWVGDAFLPDNDQIGSRLWLLSREKELAPVLALAQTYDREALQWMIDDGVVDRLDIVCTIPVHGVLAHVITLRKPDGTAQTHRFASVWSFS
ncbi:MAG TPA: phage GP46 family protein [Stellaceae bacterium]|nr:phage GP46 family protein [Stellaceae bacterium]